jgi:hypothetical protein
MIAQPDKRLSRLPVRAYPLCCRNPGNWYRIRSLRANPIVDISGSVLPIQQQRNLTVVRTKHTIRNS